MNMRLEEFSPVLSGLIGGLIAIWLSWAWERWIAKGYKGRSAEILLSEGRSLCWGAAIIFFGGVIAIILVPVSVFRNDDWRGLGVITGCTMNLILFWMWLWSCWRGRTFSEAFITFSISQKIPTIVFSGVFVGAEILFLMASVDLFITGR